MRLTFFALALSIGAILLALFRPDAEAVPTRDVDAALPHADGDLAQEVRALRDTTAELAERLEQIEMRQALLEARPTAAPRRAAATDDGDLSSGAEDPVAQQLRELAAVLENPELAPSSEFESLVVSVLEARERDEEAAREERRRLAMEQRISERVADLTDELGLDLSQAKDLHRVLTDSQLRRDEFFTRMREEGTFDRSQMREALGTIREESRTELRNFLAPAQFDRYVELEESDRRSFFGFGGPPRGPGGGPGDGSQGGDRR